MEKQSITSTLEMAAKATEAQREVRPLLTVAEAAGRLDLLRRSGPTAEAFTFRQPFGSPRPEPRARMPLAAVFCPADV